jgi:PBP1b-binding outer membrane lipoprotein LpoB
MKSLSFKSLSVFIFLIVISIVLLTGCASPKLSSDFNEEEVKKATENVIFMINEQNSEGIKELCTVQMREALTDDILKQVYEAISEGGQFEKIENMSIGGTKDKSSGEEFAVVVAKTKYEIKSFTFTISFTKQMKIAGLYYK